METRRASLIFVAAAMLVVLLALGAFAQACPAPASSARVTEGVVSVPVSSGPAVCPTRINAMAPVASAPTLLDYASLWNSGGPVQSFTGRIESVEQFYPAGHEIGPGVALKLRLTSMDTEGIPDWQFGGAPAYRTVLLGPSWYVQQCTRPLRQGELITVTGIPAVWQREHILVARDMTVDGRYIAFRNDTGYPMWAGAWQGWGHAGQAALAPASIVIAFDPNTVETVSGRIEHVWRGRRLGDLGRAEMFSLRQPDNHVLAVELAPAAFLSHCNIPVRIGAPVTVTGSLVSVRGRPTLLASQFQENGVQYALRDGQGNPAWMIAEAPAGTS